MDNIKVSVIIPVFNTGNFVSEAIESITQQSLNEIEIIIVNDGSTDNSWEIIQSFAEMDNRIKIFTQENKGQAAARNAGLKHVKGEYIYFMDSDDILTKDALQQCYEKCRSYQLDFVFFDAEVFGSSDFHIKFDYLRTHLMEDKIYTGVEAMERLLEIRGFYIPIWLNLINFKFLKTNGLDFYEGIHCEDQLFTCILYLKAQRVGMIKETFFKRRIRENSIMTARFSRKSAAGYFIVANQLLSIGKIEHSPVVNALIKDRVTDIVNNVLYQSRRLSYRDRWFSATTTFRSYRLNTSIKNILLTLFPLKTIAKTKLSHIFKNYLKEAINQF